MAHMIKRSEWNQDREAGMKNRINAALWLIALPLAVQAQTPVDEDGVIIGAYKDAPELAADVESLGNEDIPLLSTRELADLVGPIALYPDDLLAVVLPASAYPLQIMEAARFLEDIESDSSLKPDPEWDDSIVALLNYPEVIDLLNSDIDWTWRLGEAVVAQQGDVVGAIEAFRDRAYAAGNLKTDQYQQVSRNEGVIEITPVAEDVIYVPYYEPERVVVYQPRPVYYYYPRSYPVYYYPYSSRYHFDRGFFWGVTTAFTIGWMSDSLHVYHHSYHGHPYYGHSYWDRWWYRRPSINVYNTHYTRNTTVTINRHYRGDRWQPRHNRRDYVRTYGDGTRVTRNRHYPSGQTTTDVRKRPVRRNEPIRFRERPERREPDVAQRDTRRQRTEGTVREQNRENRGETRREPEVRANRDGNTNSAGRRQSREYEARDQRRRDPATQQQRREPVRQAREQRREPVVREQRREPVAREQRRREPVRQAREQQREPERQAREHRREPERQAREQRRPETRQAPRSEPPRQARREARSEPKKSDERRESRSRGKRSSRR